MMTINPATIAFVDAIAGIIFPAIAVKQSEINTLDNCKHLLSFIMTSVYLHFVSKRLFCPIPKINERMLEQAVTKSIAGSSSLSQMRLPPLPSF